MVFVTYDGTLSWRSGDDVIESSFETVLSTREASRRYRTAISTDLPDGLPRILGEADARLRALRAEGHRDAGGLVVAADSEHARRIAARLREVSGRPPVVVLHQDARAAAKLAAFTNSSDPWIVAVNMVSEGVDIPRLRVGVYATAAKTPLIFRQIVGRFVRTIAGRSHEPSWLYIPADAILRDHAATVEQELRYLIRRPGDDEGLGELDELERRATERGDTLDFQPLSADVAPQMTLFGPAPSAPPHAVPRAHAVSPARGAATARRARVLMCRCSSDAHGCAHSGTASSRIWRVIAAPATARSTRRSTGRLGIEAVDKATIEQLERSIEWLDRALYRR